MPAAADGVSRSSQYGQYCASDKEEGTDDEEQMSEGEGWDEAGEKEPENDENDSESDHDLHLVSADVLEKGGRTVVEGVIGVGLVLSRFDRATPGCRVLICATLAVRKEHA